MTPKLLLSFTKSPWFFSSGVPLIDRLYKKVMKFGCSGGTLITFRATNWLKLMYGHFWLFSVQFIKWSGIQCRAMFRTGSAKAGSIPNQLGCANAPKHRPGPPPPTHTHTRTHTHTHTQTNIHKSKQTRTQIYPPEYFSGFWVLSENKAGSAFFLDYGAHTHTQCTVEHSIFLWYRYLGCEIEDHHRNSNNSERGHLIGKQTKYTHTNTKTHMACPLAVRVRPKYSDRCARLLTGSAYSIQLIFSNQQNRLSLLHHLTSAQNISIFDKEFKGVGENDLIRARPAQGSSGCRP